jgi:hypothetical protein
MQDLEDYQTYAVPMFQTICTFDCLAPASVQSTTPPIVEALALPIAFNREETMTETKPAEAAPAAEAPRRGAAEFELTLAEACAHLGGDKPRRNDRRIPRIREGRRSVQGSRIRLPGTVRGLLQRPGLTRAKGVTADARLFQWSTADHPGCRFCRRRFGDVQSQPVHRQCSGHHRSVCGGKPATALRFGSARRGP